MGLKRNLAYNSLLTLSQYFIGFITFPYVSRVLGASGIGMVSFVDNTINYFLLFSSLGISIIGTRETARFRNDVEKLNSLFSSLMVIYIITTVIVTTAYFVAVSQIDKLHTYKELFYIGAAKIIFSVFLIEWFYKGIENFRFIAVRSIIIKLFYLVFLFVLVKDPGDYHVYFALTAGVVALNAAVNFIYAKKLTRISFQVNTVQTLYKAFYYAGILCHPHFYVHYLQCHLPGLGVQSFRSGILLGCTYDLHHCTGLFYRFHHGNDAQNERFHGRR